MESSPFARGIEKLDDALAANLSGDPPQSVLNRFEEALSAGLPPNKEAVARLLMGGELLRVALQRELTDEQTIQSADWRRAETEILRALEIDREGALGEFSGFPSRSLLKKVDLMCAISGSARAERDPQAGVAYFEAIAAHCSYLQSTPLISSYFRLGNLYHKLGNSSKAIEAWSRAANAEPVDRSAKEATVQQHARENAETAQGEVQQISSSRKGCPLTASAVVAVVATVVWAAATFLS